jgi:hypothetical protein
MEPEVRRKEIDEIWAILRETRELQRQAELRMDKAELRLDRAEARTEAADQRWEKRFEATRKLVKGGIRFVMRMEERQNQRIAAVAQTVDKLAKTQQAFLDSLRRGGNGNGRKRA